jgi:hypothetical protein
MKQTASAWVARYRGSVIEIDGVPYEISTSRGASTVVLVGTDGEHVKSASLSSVERAWIDQNLPSWRMES